MSNPRVVIGAGRPNKLPALVCEYSILKHCPEAEVVHTYHRPFIDGRTRQRDRWEDPCEWIEVDPLGTMFSFCRIMVPEICGFEGEAIYFDADQIVFDSVRELWDLPMGDAKILRLVDGQFAVLKLQCEGMEEWTVKKLLEEKGMRYGPIMKGRGFPDGFVERRIPNEWNVLDRWRPGTKLVHYTNMQTQPWVNPANHRAGHLWFDLLAEAVREGFLSRAVVEDEIRYELDAWIAAAYPQPHVLDELEARL